MKKYFYLLCVQILCINMSFAMKRKTDIPDTNRCSKIIKTDTTLDHRDAALIERIEQLVMRGANLNRPHYQYAKPILFEIVQHDDALSSLIPLVISNGAVAWFKYNDKSPLYDVIYDGKVAMAREFLKAGVYPNSCTRPRFRLLEECMQALRYNTHRAGKMEIVKMLIRSGASLYYGKPANKHTFLHYVCHPQGAHKKAQLPLIKLCMRFQLSTQAKNACDKTPLDIARDNNDKKIVENMLNYRKHLRSCLVMLLIKQKEDSKSPFMLLPAELISMITEYVYS